MATPNLQPRAVAVDPIVQAFLLARANEKIADDTDPGPGYSVATRLAQYAEAGSRDYALSWGVQSPDHGALVALLAADALDRLIDGLSIQNDRKQKVLTFGATELGEVHRIKGAMLNLWRHLDAYPGRQLDGLAKDMGLIDENGNQVG